LTSIFTCFDQATFLTLWAGAVFNTRPRCEDPLQGEGSTLLWCDVLSVTVGLVDIVVVAAIGVCFVYIKIKSMSTEAVEDEVVPVDSSTKKRRLSSRELMIEMSTQPLQTNAQAMEEGEGEVKDGEGGEGGEGGGEVTVTLGINPMHAARGETTTTASETAPDTAPETAPKTATPNAARARWNKLKQATLAARKFRNGGKQRMKRLSKVMKARQNEYRGGGGGGGDDSMGGENGEIQMKSVDTADVSMHVDEKTGRRYSCNEATGQAKWLSDDDEEGEATQGETKNHSTKRKLFRRIVGGEEDDYFVNVETEETVWYVPEDGEEVSQ
jgi:hypothetical protein